MASDLPIEEIDFHGYWLILKRRWKPSIGIFLLVIAVAFFYASREEQIYTAEAKIIFKSARSTSLTGLGEALGRIESLTFDANPLDTQVEVIQSHPILENVIQTLDLRDDEDQILEPDDLASDLSVEPIPGTDIVSIVYESSNPRLAAQIPNAIADLFIQENIRQNRAEATAAREFISQQLPQTEATLNQAESNLRQFKEQNQIVVLSEEATALVDAAFLLQDQINTVEAQIANLDVVVQDYQEQLNIDDTQQALILAALSQSIGVQKALEDLQTVEQEIAANRALFTEGSQTISRLETRRRNLEFILDQRISEVVSDRTLAGNSNLQIGELEVNLIGEVVALNAQKLGLQNQATALDQQMRRYNQRMMAMPGLERQQSQLERDLAIAKQTYETLLARFQELQVAESQNIGTVRLVSPAVIPDQPIPSSKTMVLAAGMVLGGLIGIASAFTLDLLDGTIKTAKQAKNIWAYPILGTIPSFSKAEKKQLYSPKKDWIPRIVARDFSLSPIGEAYQILQANLSFLDFEDSSRTLVISSSQRQEGRSTIAANLAFNLAQAGHETLLVDADFRAPIQHEIWNIDNKRGLKDVIANVEEFDCASQLVFPRLTVLTTGNYLNNPMTLLGSKGMALVLSQIKNRFNYVIFDAPPLLGTADASLLAKLLGNLIIVTRIGATEASNAKQVNEIIAQAEIKVLGLVINDSKSSSRTDRRYNKRMALEKENSSISEVFRDRELNLSSDTTSNASRNFKHG